MITLTPVADRGPELAFVSSRAVAADPAVHRTLNQAVNTGVALDVPNTVYM